MRFRFSIPKFHDDYSFNIEGQKSTFVSTIFWLCLLFGATFHNSIKYGNYQIVKKNE